MTDKQIKQRPNAWKTGLDEHKHIMYNPYLKRKAQAKFRNEEWKLTFDEFYNLWKDRWHLRGKKSEEYCMTRIDLSKHWELNNVIIITRHEHCVKVSSSLIGINRKRNKK